MLSWILAGFVLAEGVYIVTLLERINRIRSNHDTLVASVNQAIAERDARVAELQAKLDAGGNLTPEEESALEALEADVNPTIAA